MASSQDDDTAWIFALADQIGDRIASGNLPPQDENGFYILP